MTLSERTAYLKGLMEGMKIDTETNEGSRPSCPDQEGRRGSEEVLPENFGVPLEGDRDVGALCGSHQG